MAPSRWRTLLSAFNSLPSNENENTSVLVAGIAGFKRRSSVGNPSASFLREWFENDTFAWLVTEEILSEYKEVFMSWALDAIL
jgi:hypothetical protein